MEELRDLYNEWNKDGLEKNIQVLMVSGDRDLEEYAYTIEKIPWIAMPFGTDITSGIESVIPCTAYPTPGIINGKTGEVITYDAQGNMDNSDFQSWLSRANK